HEAIGVRLSDSIPGATTFVSFTPPAGWAVIPPAGGRITATAPRLAAGATARFTLVVHAAGPPGVPPRYVELATIAATTADPDPGNNTATLDTDFFPTVADLAVTGASAPASVRV